MSAVHRFRMAMAEHLGKSLTPEVAAAIEVAAFYEADSSIDTGQFPVKDYRGLVFSAERFRVIKDELSELHDLHFSETEKARKGLALNPDYEYVFGAERSGRLLQITARENGRLVGHARFYIYRDIHTSTLAAKEDAYYLRIEARRGFNAIRLWQYAESCLKQIGVTEVRTDSKIIFDAQGKVTRDVGRLNKFLGYANVSNGWLKTLE